MPTSGESGIGLSSTYNLRSRPLPKTASTGRPNTRSSNNKENISTRKTAPSTRLTKKTEQSSKIPVSNSKIPVPRSTRSSASSTPTRRKIPDFEKLHKSWNKKFQQGKAVAKKPCTQTAAFDLTRPGTHFKRAYYDGTKKDVKTRRQTGFALTADDEFEVDNGALNDILSGNGLEEEGKQGSTMTSRATLAGTGVSSEFSATVSGRRQTLGRLPSTGAGRVNNTSNVSSVREIDKGVMRHAKKSLVQEQSEAGITFEASADALASILNNTGLQSSDNHHNIIGGRQTIAGMSAKQRQSGRFNVTTGRTSIYYQKPKNHDVNKVYSEFAKRTLSRFTLDGNQATFKTAFIESLLPDNRGSLYIKPSLPNSEKPAGMSHTTSGTTSTSSVAKSLRAITPARVPVIDKTKSAGAIGRTPGTAARIPNPHFNEARNRQEQSCSPTLTPARRIPTTPGGQSQKNVRWADVLSTPTDGDRADRMTTKDVVAVLNFGDDGEDVVSPETKTRLHEVEKLEAETVVNRQKLNEMEEIEKQLELEIARLHEAGDVEDLESTNKPVSHPSPAIPHIVTNQHTVEGHASSMLDHVPTKQPADYVDPIKLPKGNKMEGVYIHSAAPALATHGYGNMANMELHQHAPRAVQHPQDWFQRGQSRVPAADLEREFSHPHGDRSVPTEMKSLNAVSARGIDMMQEESSLSYVPYVSRDVGGIPDRMTVQPVNRSNGVDTSVRDVRQVSDCSQRLQSPSGLDRRFENGPSELMVSDSTEAFRGVFPAFLQKSCQSRLPEVQGFPTAIAGQKGHAVLHTSSAMKPDVQDSVNNQSVHSSAYVNHHSVAEVDTRNTVPFSSAHDNISTMVTDDPHTRRTDPHLSFLNGSAENAKQHIPHDSRQAFSVATKTIPAMENPRLTIHTPQPVRSARRGTSFLKPTPDFRSISTPLHHSSVMPTPIRTPLSMRNSTLSLSRQEHQQWPSPVVAPNVPRFQLYNQNAGYGAVPNTLNTASLQQQSFTQSMRPTLSNSFGHASMAEPRYSSVHPVRGPLQSRQDHPTSSMATAFQYRRPYAASVSSERTRMIPSQGHNSGVARSLSLSDSLMGGRNHEQALPVNRQMENEREASGQLFHQVLLDEECALYACRLKGRYTPQSLEPRPINPIAKVLLHGDDMHFVPIRDIEFLVSSPTGSAFSNYYTTT